MALTRRQRQIATEICEIARKEGSYYAPYSVGLIMRQFHCRRATAKAVWAVSPYSRVVVGGMALYAPHAAAKPQVKWEPASGCWIMGTPDFTDDTKLPVEALEAV
jgi:hypothetical protein